MTAPPSPLPLVGSVASMGHCWLASAVEMAAAASQNSPSLAHPGPLEWTRFPRVATRTPGLHARPVWAAREFTIATLRRWGTTQRCEDVAVVVSELLTNALRHAVPDWSETPDPFEAPSAGQIQLGLLQPGPCVMCAVADPSRNAPIAKQTDLLAENGRGLHVVGALADLWGYTTPSDTGKVVWAIFSAPGTSHA